MFSGLYPIADFINYSRFTQRQQLPGFITGNFLFPFISRDPGYRCFSLNRKISPIPLDPHSHRAFRYGGQIALYNPKGLVSICFKVSPGPKIFFLSLVAY